MLGQLSGLALELGRVDDAAAAARRELELRLLMGDRVNAVYSLLGFAVVAGKRGRDAEAGLAWGAVEGEEGRRPVTWTDERDRSARELLAAPTPAFEAARSRGRSLTVEEAAEALLADG